MVKIFMNVLHTHDRLWRKRTVLNQSTSLSQEEKAKINHIMSLDNEESDTDSEEVDGVHVFIVRPLPWLSTEAKAFLESL